MVSDKKYMDRFIDFIKLLHLITHRIQFTKMRSKLTPNTFAFLNRYNLVMLFKQLFKNYLKATSQYEPQN